MGSQEGEGAYVPQRVSVKLGEADERPAALLLLLLCKEGSRGSSSPTSPAVLNHSDAGHVAVRWGTMTWVPTHFYTRLGTQDLLSYRK